MKMNGIKEKIFLYFKEQGKSEGLTEDTNLFKGGYVNSLFALKMVVFLEDTFNIRIKKKEINQKNFTTVNAIAELVGRLAGEQHG